MKSRALIDNIFENAGSEAATVRVELTGTPQSVQKALKHLAKQKGAAKAKVTGKEGDVKTPPELKKDDRFPKSKKDEPKKAPPKSDDDDDDKDDDGED